MRALGVDYGSKRIGLALSDELGWVAEPLEVWERQGQKEDLAHLVKRVKEHGVERIVVGLPLRQSGREGPEVEPVRLFVAEIVRAMPEVTVVTQDETLTTFEAEAQMKARGLSSVERKRQIDAFAAAVILQEDLDRRSTAPTVDWEGGP